MDQVNNIKYQPTLDYETNYNRTTEIVKMHNICAMKEYKNISNDELRYYDYLTGRKKEKIDFRNMSPQRIMNSPPFLIIYDYSRLNTQIPQNIPQSTQPRSELDFSNPIRHCRCCICKNIKTPTNIWSQKTPNGPSPFFNQELFQQGMYPVQKVDGPTGLKDVGYSYPSPVTGPMEPSFKLGTEKKIKFKDIEKPKPVEESKNKLDVLNKGFNYSDNRIQCDLPIKRAKIYDETYINEAGLVEKKKNTNKCWLYFQELIAESRKDIKMKDSVENYPLLSKSEKINILEDCNRNN